MTSFDVPGARLATEYSDEHGRPVVQLHGLTSSRHRDRLLDLTQRGEPSVFDRSIDVQVMRLRKLIEADPAQPRHIRTVWGVGYVFVPEPE